MHVALNSLSRDFVAASVALLGEGAALAEIGKRGVWSCARRAAAAAGARYAVVAVDAALGARPEWMGRTLRLLAARAGAGAARALPRRCFDLETSAEAAFRCLQGGANVGKVVVRVAPAAADAAAAAAAVGGTHVVTGGTGGLGLLTARWVAQRGGGGDGTAVVVAARGGALAAGARAAAEWALVRASGVAARARATWARRRMRVVWSRGRARRRSAVCGTRRACWPTAC